MAEVGSRWQGIFRRGKKSASEYEEKMLTIVEEGESKGELEKNEASMILNILRIEEIQAHDIMTHRNQIMALPADMTLQEASAEMISRHKTRFPVYREDLDDIIGMIHLRSAFAAAQNAEYLPMPLEKIPDLLYEAVFIPESKGISQLFREMQSQKNHFVVVVDEYGQTSGILTMEDILEEIVGNILDENDIEEKLIEKRRDGSWLMSGMVRLEDAAEVLQIEFPKTDVDTLNGFLIQQLDRIPEEDEKPAADYGGWRFSIKKIQNNMILQAEVTRCESAREESGS